MKSTAKSSKTANIYYLLKPFIPRSAQIWLRRKIIGRRRGIYEKTWPILETAGKRPNWWNGWPEGKRFSLILTHDVDTAKGRDRCLELMKIEKDLGLCSSFNFVPERYQVLKELRKELVSNGFEVGVHGLYHDGKLYQSKNVFSKRAAVINMYLKEWNAVGFRSPAMHHNLEWIHDLNIEYDASTFDTDPFEPQSDGVGTIFPFLVNGTNHQKGYVELPYTLPQDHLLFVILGETDTHIWKKKLDWIADHRGMALLNTHPDYMNFSEGKLGIEEYPVTYYEDFLKYVQSKYHEQYWLALPVDVAKFLKNKSTETIETV